eukprot:COSAG01_NODE_73424_length_245_cov_60.917808_1_plen_64_part_10
MGHDPELSRWAQDASDTPLLSALSKPGAPVRASLRANGARGRIRIRRPCSSPRQQIGAGKPPGH